MEVVASPETTWTGHKVAEKMLVSFALSHGQHFFRCFSGEANCRRLWFLTGCCQQHSKLHTHGLGGRQNGSPERGLLPFFLFLLLLLSATFSSLLHSNEALSPIRYLWRTSSPLTSSNWFNIQRPKIMPPVPYLLLFLFLPPFLEPCCAISIHRAGSHVKQLIK